MSSRVLTFNGFLVTTSSHNNMGMRDVVRCKPSAYVAICSSTVSQQLLCAVQAQITDLLQSSSNIALDAFLLPVKAVVLICLGEAGH